MRTRHAISHVSFLAALLIVLWQSWSEKHPAAAEYTIATTSVAAAEKSNRAESTSTSVYPVVRVVDGDTVIVARNGIKITVRTIGLDTPEVVDPRKPVQCFGREASAHAHQLLDGTSVTLEYDPTQGTKDKYGRTLAFVYLADGRSFEKTMITEGFGHEYTYRYPYKYQNEYKTAEKDAREHERGLWSPAACAGNTTKAASSTK